MYAFKLISLESYKSQRLE